VLFSGAVANSRVFLLLATFIVGIRLALVSSSYGAGRRVYRDVNERQAC